MKSIEKRLEELQEENRRLRSENLALKTSHGLDSQQRNKEEATTERTRLTQVRYRTVFENSLLGNKIIAADLTILQVNGALLKILGFNRKEELVGHRILEFAHPDFIADWKVLQEKLWAKQLPSFNLETCLVAKNGKGIGVSVTSILFDNEGSQLGFTIVEDIQKRKTALHSLIIREKRFRMITDIMPQQVWTAAPDGILNFVNQQVCEYFGRDSVDIIANGWQAFIHPDDVHRCLLAWHNAIINCQDYAVEFRLRGQNGDYKWYLGRSVAIIDDGAVSLWLGTNTDIDAQKTNEQRKDEFISVANHELKTPLTSLKATLQLLDRMKDRFDSKPLSNLVGQANKSINKISGLVDDLLNSSRTAEGQLPLNKTTFRVAEMLNKFCNHVRAEGKYNLCFEGDEDLQVYADQDRIDQVVINFVDNAVKYAPKSKDIFLQVEKTGEMARVSIRDTGPGIPHDQVPRLFERYYRTDYSSMIYSGLGLGLYISSEIIKQHGGEIGVDTELQKGSSFWFTLPI